MFSQKGIVQKGIVQKNIMFQKCIYQKRLCSKVIKLQKRCSAKVVVVKSVERCFLDLGGHDARIGVDRHLAKCCRKRTAAFVGIIGVAAPRRAPVRRPISAELESKVRLAYVDLVGDLLMEHVPAPPERRLRRLGIDAQR